MIEKYKTSQMMWTALGIIGGMVALGYIVKILKMPKERLAPFRWPWQPVYPVPVEVPKKEKVKEETESKK